MSKERYYFWDEMWNEETNNNENEENITKNIVEDKENKS